MNLLVVDFDFFFTKVERMQDSRFPGEALLYDWGHSEEDSVFFETIWRTRAAQFLLNGHELPGIDRALAADFWKRFTFSEHAQMLIADSNMYAAHEDVREGITSVWLFDAHHDCGYHPDAIERMIATHEINCENWMLHYAMTDVELHMRYPAWRDYAIEGEPQPLIPLERMVDDGAPVDVVFDRVFVCKSPAWVPSWCDVDWHRFVSAAPLRRKVAMDGSKRVREFNLADVEEDARFQREAIEQLKAARVGVDGGGERG